MDIIFMNFENCKTYKPQRLLLLLAEKINLKKGDKYVALLHLSMSYTNLSSKVVGNSSYLTNFPDKLLLTNTQVLRLCNIKSSTAQLSKMIQLKGFLNRLLGPLLKTGLLIIGNVPKPLRKVFWYP